MDPRASIIMAAALVFYSIGVWGERIVGRLKWWHLLFFLFGLICDTWGTGMMIDMVGGLGTGMMIDMVGGLTFDIHGVTGVLAIALMVIHAVWALVVLLRNDEQSIVNFHKFSLLVWFIWLIPYFSPVFFAMAGQ